MTYSIKYIGKGERTIAGIGAFTFDTLPKEVSKEVAMDFDNPKEKANGWVVIKSDGEESKVAPTLPFKVSTKKRKWRE